MSVTAFYLPDAKKLYSVLYVFNSISDCLVGVASLLVGGVLIQMMVSSDAETFDLNLTKTVYCLVGVATRTSVMFSLTLSVVRVINIILPQYKINYKMVVVSMVSVVVFWICFLAVDLSMNLDDDGSCTSSNVQTSYPNTNDYQLVVDLFQQPLVGKEIYCYALIAVKPDVSIGSEWYKDVQVFLLTGLPFFVPAGIATVCLLLTAYKLCSTSIGRSSRVSRDITVTVSYLTVVFVCCNVPYFMTHMIHGHPNLKNATHTSVILSFFTSTVFLLISATLNPVILIVRGRKLRSFVAEHINHVLGRCTKRIIVVSDQSTSEPTEVHAL